MTYVVRGDHWSELRSLLNMQIWTNSLSVQTVLPLIKSIPASYMFCTEANHIVNVDILIQIRYKR